MAGIRRQAPTNTSGAHAARRDHVDRLLADWARERPDLDTSPVAVIGRLGRLCAFVDAELEALFGRHGISRADFDVLATLRRSGAPFRLPQKTLMAALMRTSGTMSVRIDRLEDLGLVRREPDVTDRRNVFVALTDTGLLRVDAVAPLHLANEDHLLAALSAAERETLAGLLRAALLSFEDPPARSVSPAMTQSPEVRSY